MVGQGRGVWGEGSMTDFSNGMAWWSELVMNEIVKTAPPLGKG